MSLAGKTNAQKIWNYLIGKGLSAAGAAGVMGNLNAESALKANNLQNSYQKTLGYTDASYTKAVDSGEYTNFIHDCAGYGLAQWTYWSRKAALLAFAQAKGKSVGDLETQLDFLMKELSENYAGLLSFLKTTGSIKDASDRVLTQFERPADMGETAKATRAGYGQSYYDQFAAEIPVVEEVAPEATEEKEDATPAYVPRLTKPEKGNPYYNTKGNGGYSNAIKGKPTDADCDVLSNCVGYAYGRFNEIGQYGYCKYLVPTNAENFIQHAGSLETGNVPRVGACMVWRKGNTLSGSDGAGHVAIVEKVVSDTEVITSESGWGSTVPFYTKTRKKGSGNWGAGSSYTFLGFIYNPAPCCVSGKVVEDVKPEPETPVLLDDVKVGDRVYFNGTKHFASSAATTGPNCKPGWAKVTAIYEKGKHPYHLIRESGGGSTVYGWVDTDDIEQIQKDEAEATPDEEQIQEEESWQIGDVVEFTGTTHYSNSGAARGPACKPGKAKITAIYPKGKHPYHLIRVPGGGSNVYGWVDAGTFKRV